MRLYLFALILFALFPVTGFSASGYWKEIMGSSGTTPADLAQKTCGNNPTLCSAYSIRAYEPDPSVQTGVTIDYYNLSGFIWITRNATFFPCTGQTFCGEFSYETGDTVCLDDGYYASASSHMGYTGCDRPSIKPCGDTYVLSDAICIADEPDLPCIDQDTCYSFALTSSGCQDATDINFQYVSETYWVMQCTNPISSNTETYGCDYLYCGGDTTYPLPGTDPGATDPGITDPGTTDPGTTDSTCGGSTPCSVSVVGAVSVNEAGTPASFAENHYDSYIASTGIDEIIDTIGDVDVSFAPAIEDFGFFGFIPVLQCNDYIYDYNGHTITWNFTKLTTLRDILAWVVYLLTAFALFFIVVRKPT